MMVIITTIVKYYVFPGFYTVFSKVCYTVIFKVHHKICDISIKLDKCCIITRDEDREYWLFFYISDESLFLFQEEFFSSSFILCRRYC